MTPTEDPAQESPGSWSSRLLQACARETSSGRLIPQIDGIRSIAILAVVFLHLDTQLGTPAASSLVDRAFFAFVRRGFLGVPLFFAISAFIVALPYANHHFNGSRRPTLGNFFLRRLTRLEPPYFFNLIALWLLSPIVNSLALADSLTSLLASLIYQHNQVFGHFSTINAAAWSLEVEFQFYILAPALTFLFAIPRLPIRWLVLAVTIFTIGALRDSAAQRVHFSLLGSIEYFAAGFLAVDVYLSRWKGVLPGRLGWDVAALAGWTGFFTLNEQTGTGIGTLLHGASLALAVLGSIGGIAFSRILANRWVFTFGGMCYTIYLWHHWLMLRLAPAFNQWLGPAQHHAARFLLVAAIVLPPVIALCTALFIWVEKPFMRRDWPARVAARFRRPATA